MKRISLRKTALITAWILVNVLFFTLVSPLEHSSVLLFVGFGILAVDLYLIGYNLLRLLSHLRGRNWRHPRLVAVIWAVVAIILLSLQSIGQLSMRDGIAVVAVAVIFLLYSSYYRFKR